MIEGGVAEGFGGAGTHEGLRGGLRAVGAVLGVSVTVTDNAEWELSPDGLRVGLGWYAARGHGEAEALALALLQLWEVPREEIVAPARARRRRTLERRRATAVPLLAAIGRLQAAAELLTAMPGLRGALSAAVARSLPSDPSVLPRHLQWVCLLLWRGISPAPQEGDALAGLDTAVQREWRAMTEIGDGIDPLRRVLAPDPVRPPLRRLERAFALLDPPYERLLARDLADRGLADTRDTRRRGDDDASARDPDAPPPIGTEGAGGADPDAAGEAREGDEAPGEGADDQARRGAGRQAAEGSDLFAADQAGFTSAVLATPLPSGSAVIAGILELAAEARATGGEPGAAGVPGGTSDGRVEATPLVDYRRRVVELAPDIERMRRLWQRVIVERVALRGAQSRQALPDGDDLAVEHLASAVADARAGIPRPSAFLRYVERPRRTRSVGSTDYVLLVDRSASMQGPPAEAAADAMIVMMESLAGVGRDIAHREANTGIGLDLDVRTALIVFDAEPEVLKPLSHGIDDRARRAVHAAVRSPRGSTNDGAALRAAAEQLGIVPSAHRAAVTDGMERRRIVILLSDGGSNDPAAALRELRRLRSGGAHVHGIGLGGDDIALRYSPNGHRIDDPRDITAALEALVEAELP